MEKILTNRENILKNCRLYVTNNKPKKCYQVMNTIYVRSEYCIDRRILKNFHGLILSLGKNGRVVISKDVDLAKMVTSYNDLECPLIYLFEKDVVLDRGLFVIYTPSTPHFPIPVDKKFSEQEMREICKIPSKNDVIWINDYGLATFMRDEYCMTLTECFYWGVENPTKGDYVHNLNDFLEFLSDTKRKKNLEEWMEENKFRINLTMCGKETLTYETEYLDTVLKTVTVVTGFVVNCPRTLHTICHLPNFEST